MNKLFLTTGKELDVVDFQPKNTNLIKVKLHNNNDDVESIWAVVDEETMKKYNNDIITNGYEYYASLRNSAVAFYPNNSWGLIIPIKFNGSDIPECNIDIINFEKIIENNDGKPIFNMMETV